MANDRVSFLFPNNRGILQGSVISPSVLTVFAEFLLLTHRRVSHRPTPWKNTMVFFPYVTKHVSQNGVSSMVGIE